MGEAGTLTARQVVDTISNTLSLVDARLSDHGRRVANFVCPALKHMGRYSDRQIRDICLAALVHDIGAFKTEEVSQLLRFETVNVWDHSVFGYVFMKDLSPFAALAPAVFFHHADLEWLERLHPSYHDIAQIIHIADRLDVMVMGGAALDRKNFDAFFTAHRGGLFRGDLVDLFRDVLFGDADRDGGKADFRDVLPGTPFTRRETEDCLNMLVLSIDFRSPQTSTHTLAVKCIAKALADFMGLPEEDRERIALGAMLHDLGKQGTPLSILESRGSLSDDQMAVMRRHVVLSDLILRDSVDDDVRLIAVRHHEKLDGSGYPDGLRAEDLTLPQRLMAVADVLSALMGVRSYKGAFPKEKVMGIINEQKARGKLDAQVIDCAGEHYEALRALVDETAESAFAVYERVRDEYARYKYMVEGILRKNALLLPETLAW